MTTARVEFVVGARGFGLRIIRLGIKTGSLVFAREDDAIQGGDTLVYAVPEGRQERPLLGSLTRSK